MLLAGVVTIFAVVDRITGVRGETTPGGLLWLVATLSCIGLSLAVAWIAFREMLSPEGLLDFGLGFEVVQALCLAVLFHSLPLSPGSIPRGWSAVAVWILAYPLIVPNTRNKTIAATLVAAAMDPIGLGITILAGNPIPPGQVLLRLFLPTAIAAGVAIFISRIIYALAVEAGRGLELGSYSLEELLGRGGMGEVWKASHRLLARSAAVKLIRPEGGSDSRELLRRFEREARATAGLRSPHTVDVYDFGTTADGTFYYVMELLDGYDLETLIAHFGALPPERVVFILGQACHSLAEAHQGGLIHRDVKPANIYVCRYGLDWDFVKLLDFGLVKSPGQFEEGGRQLTVAGLIAGTPGYMSPEMALGSPDVDWRTDIYALGCVAYWLLTGRTVFEGGTPMQRVMDHVQKTPVAPSHHAKQPIPEALDAIVLSCLEKDPADRPQTMDELAGRLRSVPLEGPWSQERARRWWLENPPAPGAAGAAAPPQVGEPTPLVRAARN